jgi:branched-chain amino acid transport system substrate-binding protein
VGQDRMDPRADEYRDLASEIAETRPDAIYFGGGETSNAVRLWRDLDEAVPGALLIGSNNLLVPEFYERLGRAERRTYLTSVAQHPSQLPPGGRRFVRDYSREFGERPEPLAAYGSAALSLVLNALERAGDKAAERERVVKELLDTEDFNSVVGRFSIDDNGDTSLERLAGYRVRDGRLVFAVPLRGRSQ